MLGFNLVLLFLRFLFLYYYCSDFGFRFFFLNLSYCLWSVSNAWDD